MEGSGSLCATDTGVETKTATADALERERKRERERRLSFHLFFSSHVVRVSGNGPIFFILQRFKDELKAQGVMRFTSAPINSGFLTMFEVICMSHITQSG